MSDKQEVIQQVEKFDKGKLKKSNTEEKNYIPTQQGRCLRENKFALSLMQVLPFPQLLV